MPDKIDATILKELIDLGDRLTEDRLREIVIAEIESNEMDGVAQAYALEEADGDEKKANVTREQLQKTGLSLRDYLNFMDKNDRRPRSKADSTAAKALTAAFKAKKAKKPVKKAMGGGMMKSKMKAKGMKAGGKMKSKGYSAGGGPLKKAPEGNTGLKKLPKEVRNKMGFMAKGGMMKTKGYSKGGAAGGKKQKVRGAGIARKGVRSAKMR